MAARIFGTLDGQPVYEVTIGSRGGLQAHVITYGAVLRDLRMRWRGAEQRLVLGLNSIEDYVRHSRHFGSIVGRCANRIAHGRFTLDGQTFQLPLNDRGTHSLHGGATGFGRRAWQLSACGESFASLTLVSPDGDCGYPGTATVTCTYRMLEPATLRVDMTAVTDAATPFNLTQHSYFNLDGSADVLDHELQLDAEFYTPTDADGIPTGEISAVAGTAWDFREPRPVRTLDADGQRVRYDTNFALNRRLWEAAPTTAAGIARAATVRSRSNGLKLEVWTTEPGLQFYDGYKLDVPVAGLGGAHYAASAGLCLEPQRFPDGPNRAHFPDTILRPGRVYRHLTEFRFGPVAA